MQYNVRHLTEYVYQGTVIEAFNRGYMLPRTLSCQRLCSQTAKIYPTPSWRATRTDAFGNQFLYFVVSESHNQLRVEVNSTIEMDANPAHFIPAEQISVGAALVEYQRLRVNHPQIEEFLNPSPFINVDGGLADLVSNLFTSQQRPLLDVLLDLTRFVFEHFEYAPGFSTISTPLSDVVKHKRGVCQDFAHLSIGILRSKGIPARYVSGYLETLPPPGEEKLIGSDASHAWFEVFFPGQGWYGFDPTNNQIAGQQHIITARGRDYGDVPPLQGIFFGHASDQGMTVEVDVIAVAK